MREVSLLWKMEPLETQLTSFEYTINSNNTN